jgi:hypothetical protein
MKGQSSLHFWLVYLSATCHIRGRASFDVTSTNLVTLELCVPWHSYANDLRTVANELIKPSTDSQIINDYEIEQLTYDAKVMVQNSVQLIFS